MTAQKLIDGCRQQGLKFATAESCTGGAISAAICEVPGASDIFRGSVVCYQDDVKVKVLGVSKQTIDKHTVVSEEVARAMLVGVLELLEADVGIATTGYAGPSGGDKKNPVGTVWVAYGTAGLIKTKRLSVLGNRQKIIQKTVSESINLALSELV